MTRSRPARWAGATLAILVLLVGVTFAVPSFRAAAAELLGFTRADSDREILTMPFSAEGPTFLSSIEQIEEVAGFDVLEPTRLPPGVTFKYGEAADHFAILQYQRAEHVGTGASLFGIVQGQREPGPAPFSEIGASAQVELVQIGEVQGEYVKGGWVASNVPPPSAGIIELDRQWDPTQPSQQLQWYVGDRVFTIHTGPDLTKDDLVAIAQSLR